MTAFDLTALDGGTFTYEGESLDLDAATAASTAATAATHGSSFAAFTRQLTCVHELLVSSANNIARDLE